MSTSPATHSPSPTRAASGVLTALAVDALLVVVFALLGARTHHDGELGPGAVADVAWPFLVSLLAGHLALGLARRVPATVSSGAVVWVTTLVGGMVLRRATGDGTALAFVVVATAFTLATLVGWRLLVLLLARVRVRS
ncbi:DUF3054 domain-containing protein [Nocardioides sp. Y6]|uniref:DUF3054 domain-containing protein n=1 Tax=Nocardioides malaquae TaxID=2773426 RepID=A0ABR9RSW4_9ACTN|nr:DUF3054 domain-containing protein [Nocardioides malaquae]MBE7324669.1 DUF3054 domain-containing protein [Nocardioides malaquae]